jgi:hypothetical protein
MVFVRYALIRTIFIWLIWDGVYSKNLSAVEKSLKIFWFFIIFQLSLSLLMKIVETINKIVNQSPKYLKT